MAIAFCYFFVFLVEAAILWQYASNLFIPKHSVKDRIAAVGSSYFALFIVSFFENSWLNTFMFCIANFIILSTQCKVSWYSAFFHSAIITAVMCICELMVYGIILRFFPRFSMNTGQFYDWAMLGVFSKIFYFSIIYILIHFLKKRQKHSFQQDKSVFFLYLIPINSIFVVLTLISVGEISDHPTTLDWMITLSAVLLLISDLLVFGINQHNQQKSMEFLQMQRQLQKESDFAEYYKTLALQEENQNILIHDTKKHLQTISLLNSKKEHDKIDNYIQQLMLSSNLNDMVRFCGHDVLNAILYRYKQQCDKLQIDLCSDIRSGTTDFISDYDLTSLFNNLLDNAVDAAIGIPNASIKIAAYKQEHDLQVIIMVTNSCKSNPFSRNSGRLITTKSDRGGHGYGLKSIRRVIDVYDGKIDMRYDEDTMTFHTIIMLKEPPHDGPKSPPLPRI